MRNLLLVTSLLASISACDNGPGALPDPPVLKVTSPARSLIQNGTAKVTVTGTVTPNAGGVPISKVMVNNVGAIVGADGSFTTQLDVKPGAMLIHTEAVDQNGGKATDTRSVEAGMLRAPGTNIEGAITTALSKEAFAKIAGAAGPIIKGMDLKAMVAPMQPMVHAGDPNGPDCLYAQLFVEDVKLANAIITLVPVDGGLSFSAEIDGLDVPGHMKYAVACISGNNTTRIQATKVVIGGTLMVAPDGMNGFTTELASPTIQLAGLDITASGLPGTILSILPLDSAIQAILPKVAGMVMKPMMNQALGALGGPKQLDVLGKMMTVQVKPADITFTADSGIVTLDMQMMMGGAEGSKGFIFTDNGMPIMDPGTGLQLGLADDLVNSMLSQAGAIGMLSVTMPANGGTFNATQLTMTSPPMISADPTNGKMRVILPDMSATFMLDQAAVGHAAINATLDLNIVPASGGFGIAIQLGAPEINVDVLDDITNATLFTDDDLATAIKLCLDSQIHSMTALLGGIPLPAMAGLQMKDLSIGADQGYVMMRGALQ